jgi:hypothetical protein
MITSDTTKRPCVEETSSSDTAAYPAARNRDAGMESDSAAGSRLHSRGRGPDRGFVDRKFLSDIESIKFL